MRSLRLAVLISGRGSNLQALIDACAKPDFPAQIVAVIANKPDAGGLARAADAGIPAMIVDSSFFKGDKAGFERALGDTIAQFDVDLICLAGFMRILSADFLNRFKDKVINIHPSLLPKHKGLDTHARAIEAGDKVAGCSVHIVTPEMDEGDIILQKTVPVLAGDTPQSLAERVLEQEHAAYPEAVLQIATNHVILRDARVIIANSKEDPMSQHPTPNTPHHDHEAVGHANNMWNTFVKISTYAGGATILVLVLLALFVA